MKIKTLTILLILSLFLIGCEQGARYEEPLNIPALPDENDFGAPVGQAYASYAETYFSDPTGMFNLFKVVGEELTEVDDKFHLSENNILKVEIVDQDLVIPIVLLYSDCTHTQELTFQDGECYHGWRVFRLEGDTVKVPLGGGVYDFISAAGETIEKQIDITPYSQFPFHLLVSFACEQKQGSECPGGLLYCYDCHRTWLGQYYEPVQQDLDENADKCLEAGYTWFEETCCGDDADEFYNHVKARNTDHDFAIDWSGNEEIAACCSSPTNCVDLEGNCVADHESASGFNPEGNDNVAVCEWPNEDWWFDCDYSMNSCADCDLNFVDGVCCGDDANEHYSQLTAEIGICCDESDLVLGECPYVPDDTTLELGFVSDRDFTFNLKPGFNYISFPLQPQTNNIAEFFEPIADKIRGIKTLHDNLHRSYSPHVPGWVNNLETIEIGRGYELIIKGDVEPFDFRYTGTPVDLDEFLATYEEFPEHYTMIGLPTLESVPVESVPQIHEADRLALFTYRDDIILPLGEDKEDYKIRDPTTIEPGKGYYIYIREGPRPGTQMTFTFNLKPGVNLISLPLEPETDRMDEFFEPIKDKVIKVKKYNPHPRVNLIAELDTDIPNYDDIFDNFEEIEVGKGYMVIVKDDVEPFDFPYTGTVVNYEEFSRDYQGPPFETRNIVGFPTMISRNMHHRVKNSNYVKELSYYYDDDGNPVQFEPNMHGVLPRMVPGKAHMLYVKNTHTFRFKPGFNYFSLPLKPKTDSMDEFFEPIFDKVIKVQKITHSGYKTNGFDIGETYDDVFDTFNDIDVGIGYRIKIKDDVEPFEFTYEGDVVDFEDFIKDYTGLHPYYNIVGFPTAVVDKSFDSIPEIVHADKTKFYTFDSSGTMIENPTVIIPGRAYVIRTDPEDVSIDLELNKGLNLIALPFESDFRTLCEATGATTIIKYMFDEDSEKMEPKGNVCSGGTGTAQWDIELGKGYIVQMQEAKTVTVSGKEPLAFKYRTDIYPTEFDSGTGSTQLNLISVPVKSERYQTLANIKSRVIELTNDDTNGFAITRDTDGDGDYELDLNPSMDTEITPTLGIGVFATHASILKLNGTSWFFPEPETTTTTTTVSPAPTCTDSDGMDFFQRGTVDGAVDHCCNDGAMGYIADCETINTLMEYHCDNAGVRRVEFHECPYGCQEGACLPYQYDLNEVVSLGVDEIIGYSIDNAEIRLKVIEIGQGYKDFCRVEMDRNGRRIYTLYEGLPFTYTYEKDRGFLFTGITQDNKCNIIAFDANIACEDSDGSNIQASSTGTSYNPGPDRSTFGTLTVAGQTFEDVCVDRIENSDDNTVSYEYGDQGSHVAELACVNGEVPFAVPPYTCANGCQDGECVTS